ncbi:MAG: protoporphyrinogen oxidase [Hyphomicrobiales bacterium]|nr:protoporphyrinogen oxidase [Hyphomicrobiales bacterium]
MIDTVIIGGGVSGLTVAYELMHKGRDVVLLERQVAVGGNAVSERIGGFLMEHGPSSLNATVESANHLSTRLGLDDEQVFLGKSVKYRYLTKGGRLSEISTHPLGFFTSSYLSPRGRLAIAAELLKPAGRDDGDESVDAFCRRRFGAEFAERVIDPLTGGLFAAHSSELCAEATFPALVNMERQYRSVVAGAIKRRMTGRKMPARRLYSWQNGIGTLPMALSAALNDRIRTGVAVNRIEARPNGFYVDGGSAGTLEARSVVLATQPHVAGTLLETIKKDAAAAALDIPAPPIAVVFMGFRRNQVAHPLQGLGYLTASGEDRPVSGALFASSMFAGRAPPGHVAISAYVGGSRAPDLALQPAKVLVDIVTKEFRDILGTRGEPQLVRVRQWPRGLPQTSLGHQSRMAALADAEDTVPGLFLTGNYFSGPGVAACVTRAIEAAGRIDGYLDSNAAAPFTAAGQLGGLPHRTSSGSSRNFV